MIQDKFGPILSEITVTVPNKLSIRPVDDFNRIVNELKLIQRDGLIEANDLIKLKPTHKIEYNGEEDKIKFRKGTGKYILGLIDLIYETKLQWEDWCHEGSVPTNVDGSIFLYNGQVFKIGNNEIKKDDELSHFIAFSLSQWNNYSDVSRELILNAMLFHQKAVGYKYGFEKFTVDYYAIDTVWKFGIEIKLWTNKDAKGHKERINAMISKLEMAGEPHDIEAIYQVRNYLVHEGRWGDGNILDIGYKDGICYMIHRFVKRLLIAAIGTKNSFTKSSWQSMSPSNWNNPYNKHKPNSA